MPRTTAKLPDDLRVGMRIATNKIYAAVFPRSVAKTGVIVGATHLNKNMLYVFFDGGKHKQQIHRNCLEVLG